MTRPAANCCVFASVCGKFAPFTAREGHDPPLQSTIETVCNNSINRKLAVCLYPKNDHIIVTITRSVPGEVKERAALWRGMQKRYGSRNDSHNAPAPLLACSLVTFLQEQESHAPRSGAKSEFDWQFRFCASGMPHATHHITAR